jgi:hypothetical protein
LLMTVVGKSETAGFLALMFLLGIGILMATGAMFVFLVCGIVKPARPPLFADPSPPPRPDEDEA